MAGSGPRSAADKTLVVLEALASHSRVADIAKIEGARPYILATMPADEVRALVRRAGMPVRTEHTHTDENALLDDLAEVRRRGYAEDHEENEAGVRAVGAAIPERRFIRWNACH